VFEEVIKIHSTGIITSNKKYYFTRTNIQSICHPSIGTLTLGREFIQSIIRGLNALLPKFTSILSEKMEILALPSTIFLYMVLGLELWNNLNFLDRGGCDL